MNTGNSLLKTFKLENYKDRIRKSKEKLTKAFNLVKVDEFPLIIRTRPYYLTGTNPCKIPEDYFENPKTMMEYQAEGFAEHMEQVDDDTVPYLMPWLGTGVIPSAFGSKIKFGYKSDPAVCSRAINNIKEIAKIKVPDFERDGLMPRVLEFINYMKDNDYGIPVSITDTQSPLDSIGVMCGHENLYYWIADDPSAVKHLFEVVTETLILWIKKQKEILGLEIDEVNGLQDVWTPKGVGIWISEDDDMMTSPKIWENFVKEPVERILNEFGSGFLHFCGNPGHLIDSYKKLKGLSGFNNWVMGNIENAIYTKKNLCEDRCFMICDFAPINIEEYYNAIIDNFDPTGIIILAEDTEELASHNGSSVTTKRDRFETAKRILSVFNNKK